MRQICPHSSEAEPEQESFKGNDVRDSFASADGRDSDDDLLESSNGNNSASEGLSPDQQQEEQSSDKRKLKEEIVCVICKALMPVNQMHGLFNDFQHS